MPLYWSEELSRYLFVWLSILGATIALQKRGHFGVDIFFLMLPEKGRHFMKLLSVLLVGALALVILIHGISLVEKTSTQYSPAMEIPMNWAYASLPVGAALMLIHTAVIVLKEGSRTKSTE
jgi:TRAP-type C4-dicarboxylate transport system permease small subunit